MNGLRGKCDYTMNGLRKRLDIALDSIPLKACEGYYRIRATGSKAISRIPIWTIVESNRF